MAESIWGRFSPESLLVKGIPDDLYTPTADKKYPLGSRVVYKGRTYHYAYAGGVALAAGKVVYSTTFPAECNKAVAAAAAIGDEVVYVTTVAAQANLEGGSLIVNDEDGEGTSYPIKYSEANADTATSTNVYLDFGLTAALTTSSEVELYSSPFYDLDIQADQDRAPIGVPMMAVTANYYFWIQTWGPASVLVGNTVAYADRVAVHTTDGSVYPIAAADTLVQVGFSIGSNGGVTGEYNGLFLTLFP